MSDEEYVAYSCNEYAERLTASTVYEAVIEYVDQWDAAPTINDMVKVTGFRRMLLPSREFITDQVLDHILEWLDDEYGDPNGEFSEDAAGFLREDAERFADAVRSKYTPWTVEPAESWMVNVAEYVPAEWLRE